MIQVSALLVHILAYEAVEEKFSHSLDWQQFAYHLDV
jgi:hypothetical protein